jgi:hypothetical protein
MTHSKESARKIAEWIRSQSGGQEVIIKKLRPSLLEFLGLT